MSSPSLTPKPLGRKGTVPDRKCLLSTCWEKRNVPWVAFCSEEHLNIYVNRALAAAREPKGVSTAFVAGRIVVGV